MRLPPVLLLDLDDTIVSFSATPRDFWREAYRKEQLRFGEISEERFIDAVQVVGREFWREPGRAFTGRIDLLRARRKIAEAAFERIGLHDQSLGIEVADYYTWEKESAVAPFPGAIDTLLALRARGVRLGLISNGSSSFQRKKLLRFDLERFFEVILIEGELGFGKPDPRIFQQALDQLRVSADDAWMVGDNLQADIAGAKQVGLLTVWNDYAGSGLPRANRVAPDMIIRRISDLIEADLKSLISTF